MLPGTPIILVASAMAMSLVVYLKVPAVPMPPITVIDIDDHSGWWNPAWSYQPGDVWIIGRHSYTTRDLMGRRL